MIPVLNKISDKFQILLKLFNRDNSSYSVLKQKSNKQKGDIVSGKDIINLKDQVVLSIGQNGGQTAHTIVNNKLPQRTILSIKTELIEELRKFSRNYKILLSSGDHEMEVFANEINQIFKESGWNNIGFIYNLAGFYDPGVTIGVTQVDKINQLIANLFYKSGVKITANKYNNIKELNIIIGPNV